MEKKDFKQIFLKLLFSTITLYLTGIMIHIVNAQELSMESKEVVLNWTLNNCDVAEKQKLVRKLERWGEQLESVFIKAAVNGPGEALILENQKSSALLFERRQKLLLTGEGLGLSEKDIIDALKVTREQFIAQEGKKFILRYKSQALLGLGTVGGDKAMGFLNQIKADEKSPLKSSAEFSLRKLTSK